MRKWRLDIQVEHAEFGIDRRHDLLKLLDLRLEDDIKFSALTPHAAFVPLKSVMQEFGKVGPVLC